MMVPGAWSRQVCTKAARNSGRRLAAVAVAALLAFPPSPALAADRSSSPWIKFSFESLGIPALSANFLSVGASMMTVHFADSTHLLVTYSMRGLVPRLAGEPVDHDDRKVAAELVELPSGKIVARTEWHMHDHGRYLWNLGQGRFLVRIGDTLHAIAPVANLSSGAAFRKIIFPYRPFQMEGVLVSADNGLVLVESRIPRPRNQPKQIVNGDTDGPDAGQPKPMIAVDFYRLSGAGSAASPLAISSAGSVLSSGAFVIPVDADGYLWATEDARNRWTLTFDDFNGKSLNTGQIDSSCDPTLQLVSKSQFVTITCRGSDDRLKLAAYGFDGHETWEESLSDFSGLTYEVAPEAGRFAMSRIYAQSTGVSATGVPDSTQKQEVRVYQTESGDQLLKLSLTPIFKTSENFDLSSDGSLAVAVQPEALALYRLAPPSAADLKDLAEVQKFAPPSAGDAQVKMERITRPVAVVRDAEGPGVADGAGIAAVTPAPAAAPVTSAPAETIGDTAEPVRKPPTLLNPGEKAEMQGKGNTH